MIYARIFDIIETVKYYLTPWNAKIMPKIYDHFTEDHAIYFFLESSTHPCYCHWLLLPMAPGPKLMQNVLV